MNDKSWRDRLFGGFRKTSDKLGENLTGLFSKAALDNETLDEIEEALEFLAAACNHAEDAKVEARLDTIYRKLEKLIE